MESGIIPTAAHAVEQSDDREAGSVVHRIELLRGLAEALCQLSQHPSSTTLLWALRVQCERLQSDRWRHDANEPDVVKAYFESVGGHASRWVQQLAAYETALARATSAVEAYGAGCLRRSTADAEAHLGEALIAMSVSGRMLRKASIELADSVEKEAAQLTVRCRFCGSGVRRRIETVRTLAGHANTRKGA